MMKNDGKEDLLAMIDEMRTIFYGGITKQGSYVLSVPPTMTIEALRTARSQLLSMIKDMKYSASKKQPKSWMDESGNMHE